MLPVINASGSVANVLINTGSRINSVLQ